MTYVFKRLLYYLNNKHYLGNMKPVNGPRVRSFTTVATLSYGVCGKRFLGCYIHFSYFLLLYLSSFSTGPSVQADLWVVRFFCDLGDCFCRALNTNNINETRTPKDEPNFVLSC
jgi:hypothetical protein